MISYVTLGVSDLTAAKAFYGQLLGDLGSKSLIDMGRIAFFGKSMAQPMLAVCVPFNQQPANPGNGNMVSFSPGSKAAVDTLYQKAISLGATCDGAPGQRIENTFYGAYVKDADGNKLCFCHFG
ncbi:VOC family protein [Rheinheimera baltica]|uniref:VOC family protein n=1 Tax=Rheinheimera baltica TaxID=67576 RepID=A0ABT9I348_9GAMM|nr:VOC family protein [Rheinheimera baltica]MDP5137810.1 VOC family protein [Rheinheimera baltica]MDP5142006.1 VOC family protein [Rheinheimera baltica]MDP5150624.1 VOC family protein [Rheinheimera baltica]MDP5189518.1 VOC family protein [Rheinheimera baltica]